MKRIAKIVASTIAILSLTLAFGIATSRTVRAAVSALVTVSNTTSNPVPIKNVAAPGEFPYQQEVGFVQNPSICTNFVCVIRFDVVPAGHRLVITHAAGRFKLGNGNSGGSLPNVSLSVDGSYQGTLQLPVPQYDGFSSYIASSPVTFYVEAGHQPSLLLAGQFVATDDSYSAEATVVGYLIPTP